MRVFCVRRFKFLLVLKILLVALMIFSLVSTFIWSYEFALLRKWLLGQPKRFAYQDIGLATCPVCFGIDSFICHLLLGGNITVKINAPWTEGNTKGVAYGSWDGQKVVVKRLGTKAEIAAMDNNICRNAGKDVGCDVRLHFSKSHLLSPEFPLKLAINKYMDCPSYRFLDRVQAVYGETSANSLSRVEVVHLLTGLSLNPELLLLQIFTHEEGWPFPKFYGVCGRVMVVENAGPSLTSFLGKPWNTRAKLAIRLLNLARLLTHGPDDWALYMGDASLENFGVSDDGEVFLLDLEHLVVVDLRETQLHSDEVEHQAEEDKCDINRADCLSYSPSNMCLGGSRDYNYYAICRGVLRDFKTRKGLLHSPPASRAVLLMQLLDDCVSGKTVEKRMDIVAKLTATLYRSTLTENNRP